MNTNVNREQVKLKLYFFPASQVYTSVHRCCGRLAAKFKEEIRIKYNTDIMDSPGKRKKNKLKMEKEMKKL